MKKFLITTIILLVMLLLGQLIYFNFSNKKSETKNTNSVNIINNNVISGNQTEEIRKGVEEDIVVKNVIQPVNIAELSQKYKGNTKLIDLEKELYTFGTSNIKNIYNMTVGRSVNQTLQLYDLSKEEINKMHIYTAEDFNGISAECLKINRINTAEYLKSNVDMETYNDNENGYTTFYIKIAYTNSSEIKIKVYIANGNNTVPNIKFGK